MQSRRIVAVKLIIFSPMIKKRLSSWIILSLISIHPLAQQLTGTWEGNLITGALHQGGDRPRIATGVPMTRFEESSAGGDISGLARSSKMIWELVQVDKKVYGMVFFYPQNTQASDRPICRYTWEGALNNDTSSAFTFIQGRLIDGISEMPIYQFTVKILSDKDTLFLQGPWYRTLETLHTMERPSGYFKLQKINAYIQSPFWLSRKRKALAVEVNRAYAGELR